MVSYETMKENYGIIKEFCRRFRRDLTLFGGLLGEEHGLVDYLEYERFMNELTLDAFVGNYLNGLLVSPVIESYERCINNENSFVDFLRETNPFWDILIDKYLELV